MDSINSKHVIVFNHLRGLNGEAATLNEVIWKKILLLLLLLLFAMDTKITVKNCLGQRPLLVSIS